tara:strand:+ start:2741 stop:3985 length:1245 start_codon:yes stop_codon:yes gene_type:complete
MSNKVLLLDDLGKKYGETHVYHNLRTPADAIKLLCINYPEFAKDLATSHEQGIFYKVTQVNQDLDYSELNLPIGSHDLVVIPVISGSKNAGRVLLGVGLIVATGGIGSVLGLSGTNAASLFGSKILGSIVGNIGVNLVLNGISNMLAPQPVLPESIDFDGAFTNFSGGPGSLVKGADGKQSFAYTGPTNISGLGKTIPVIYGKVLAGSLIIGAQIEPESENTTKATFFRKAGKQTFTLNGDELEGGYSDAGGLTARLFQGAIKTHNGKKYYNGLSKTVDFDDSEQHFTPTSLGGRVRGEKSGKHSTKRYTMAFTVKGLIDRIGRDGTTFIDGFITFQVIIQEDSSKDVVGRHQMTIRGLLQPSEAHKVGFIVKLPYAKVPGKDNYKVLIKVIDHSIIKSKCELRLVEHGTGLKT